MSHDQALEFKRYQSENGRIFRVDIERDPDAESPRDWDTPVHIVTMDRNYRSPDKGDPTQYAPFEHFEDSRRLARYINLFRPDIKAYGFVYREDRDGTLSVYTDPIYFDGRDHPAGIAVIDAAEQAKHGMDDFDRDRLNAIVKADVETYNQWVRGEVVGWQLVEVKSCNLGYQHDEHLDSCYGYFPDDDYEYGDLYIEAIANIDGTVTEVSTS